MHAGQDELPGVRHDHSEHPHVHAAARRVASRSRAAGTPSTPSGPAPCVVRKPDVHDHAAGDLASRRPAAPAAGRDRRARRSAAARGRRRARARSADDQVHHRRAVHREELVVLLVGEHLHAGHGELGAHEEREDAPGQEVDAREPEQAQAERLVVGRRDEPDPPADPRLGRRGDCRSCRPRSSAAPPSGAGRATRGTARPAERSPRTASPRGPIRTAGRTRRASGPSAGTSARTGLWSPGTRSA